MTLALLLVACGRNAPTPEATEAAEAPAGDHFQYASVSPEPAARPSRFDAAFPPALDGWSAEHPPRVWVQAGLCAGDKDLLSRARTTYQQAPSTELALGFGELVRYCTGGTACDVVAKDFALASDPRDKTLLAALHMGCPDAAAMEDPAVPDAVVLAHYASLDEARLTTYSPRLGRILRSLPAEPPKAARMAALHHGDIDDERVAADLLAAADTVTSPQVLGGIYRALGAQSDPRAKARWSSWCAQGLDGFACQPLDQRYQTPVPPAGRKASKAAARLVELHLADEGLVANDVWSLAAHGAVGFDTETGQWPNEHDGLLTTLWTRARHLPPAVFTETPPARPDRKRIVADAGGGDALSPPTGDAGVYRLTGYAEGKRWQVVAQDRGDWYDVDAVLGLLNTMARDLDHPIRFVPLDTGDQMSVVLPGHGRSLNTAIAEGLLPVGPAAAGEQRGKDFEKKAIEALFRKMEEGRR